MPTPISFRDLLPSIEKDFLEVYESSYARNRLFYTIRIDDSNPGISARVLLGKNRRTRISFIVSTPVGNSQTSLYLSEMDIIDVIYRLEPDLYEHLMSSLRKVIQGQIATNGHSVLVEREQLFDAITSFSEVATAGLVFLPRIESRDIKTPFGITLSYRTFCEFLSLSLSTEEQAKLKRIATKYYIISHLLRNEKEEIPIPSGLQHLRTLEEIKNFYKELGVARGMRWDKNAFRYNNYASYFQTH